MGNRTKSSIAILALFLTLAVFNSQPVTGRNLPTVTGQVVDDQNEPIPGASVYLLDETAIVNAGFTDSKGRFELDCDIQATKLSIRVSSVGYESYLAEIESVDDLEIKLTPRLTEVKGISVTPPPEPSDNLVNYETEDIARAASASLVPSNPLAAIKSPMVTRAGSNHSSTLRVNGTNPVYSLNGVPIGSDPAHYGAFAIIPSAVVDRMHFQSLGSSAANRLPTYVELETPVAFGQDSRGELDLSTIDANLYYQQATDKFFVVGSIRKSVLDHLVNQIDIKSERLTLPPTNFSDLFVSGGVSLSPEARLMVDHYQVDDYLRYNTEGAGTGAYSALQKTAETYYAARLELLSGPLLVRANLSTRKSARAYSAEPSSLDTKAGVNVNVHERLVSHSGRLSFDYDFRRARLNAGVEVEADVKREYSLQQTNWNFLPPFSPSDNPYIYQIELNDFMDHSSGRAESRSTAGFVSVNSQFGPVQIENGLRVEKFDQLQDGQQLLWRNRVSVDLQEYGRVSLFAGDFAQSPVDNILEPFQVLVREDLINLSPINSSVYSIRYNYGPLELDMFRKHFSRMPLPTHNFDVPSLKEIVYRRDFIQMQSTGELTAQGVNLTFDKAKLWHGRLDLYAYYAFTSTQRVSYGLTLPYEYDAPHRFMTQLTYRVGDKLALGSEVQIRSGYPYSPLRDNGILSDDVNYSAESFEEIQSKENSRRFPINAHLNLNAQYDFGQVNLSLSLFNVTNRANPMVSSHSGLVHDAGILPMLGLKYHF